MPVGRQANDQLEFLCKTASVPEVAADTIAVQRTGSHLGVVREQVSLITYAKPFSITVISDRDYIVYKEMRNGLILFLKTQIQIALHLDRVRDLLTMTQ